MFCICLPSVSQVNLTKSIQKKGGQKRINQLTCFNQPNILESKNPMQTRPFNIDPCRCRCPNLHNPLRSVFRSFSSSDMDLPGQREFFKKNYKICDQKKLIGDPRTIWKTYQKIQHSLRHVLSITNDQLDFSISVGKGRADSSEIGLLD